MVRHSGPTALTSHHFSGSRRTNVTSAPPIAFRSGSTFIAPSSSPNSIMNTPAGIQVGDLLVTMQWFAGASPTITPPSGWTLVNSQVNAGSNATYFYSRQVTGTEASTYTWTWGLSFQDFGGVMAAYKNATAVDAVPLYSNVGTGTGTIASVTASKAGDYWLSMYWQNNAHTVASAPGFTSELFQSLNGTSNPSNGLLDKGPLVASGATGTATITFGASGNNMVTSMLIKQ